MIRTFPCCFPSICCSVVLQAGQESGKVKVRIRVFFLAGTTSTAGMISPAFPAITRSPTLMSLRAISPALCRLARKPACQQVVREKARQQGNRASTTNLKMDGLQRGFLTLGFKLVSNGPAWRLGGGARFLLKQKKRIQFNDHHRWGSRIRVAVH